MEERQFVNVLVVGKYVYNQNVGMKVQVMLRNGAILDNADLDVIWPDGGAAGLQKDLS